MGAVLAVVVPWLTCWLALRSFADRSRGADLALAAALGAGASMGLASWTYAVALAVGGSHVRAVRIDGAFWLLALAAAAWAMTHSAPARSAARSVGAPGKPWGGFAAIAAFVVMG